MNFRKILNPVQKLGRVNRKNVLTLLLLAGIVFSAVQIGRSASPNPGHDWLDLGDNPSDALPVNRGGTASTTLAANGVVLGEGTNAVSFVSPGNAGNVLTSNGRSWISSEFNGLVLLNPATSETNSSEITGSTSETTLLSYALPANIDPSAYRYYILEADVMGNQGASSNANVLFNWNFYEGANRKRALQWRFIGSSATGIVGGVQQASTIKTIVSNSGLPGRANFKINGQMSVSNAADTMMAHSFRVYGVK